MTPDAVMIFAAGLGTRMGELTRDRPKPLIEVAGRPLIDHALALVRAAGIGRIVVNTHAHADRLAAHLARVAPEAAVSHEPERLETGGGLKRALPLLPRGSGLHAQRRHGLDRAEPAHSAGRRLDPRNRRAFVPGARGRPRPGTPGRATSSSSRAGGSADAARRPPHPMSTPGRRSSTRPRSRASRRRCSRSTRSGTR